MEKSTRYILLGAGIVAVGAIIYFKNKNDKQAAVDATMQNLCFSLPRTADTTIFGPAYWNAFHTLAANIPCGGCRGFAEKFMIFFHDLINVKTLKPIQNQENFDYFTQAISQYKITNDFNKSFGFAQPE